MQVKLGRRRSKKYHKSYAKKLLLIHKKKKNKKPSKIYLYQDAPRLAKLHHCVGSFTGFAHLNS
jgi:hypothetical protein